MIESKYLKEFNLFNKIVNYSKSTRGRPYKYSNEEMFNCIVEVLKLGCSWSDISKHYSFHKDTVRKRFKRWTTLNIFENFNKVINKIYKKKVRHFIKNDYYIDSTDIPNFRSNFETGYNYKIKNKKAIKLTIITDSNGIIHKFNVSRSSKHDAMILEDIIQNDLFKNKDEMILVGDKGYIKNDNYRNKIKKNHNILLITPQRINSKKEIKDVFKYKTLFKKRIIVENKFSHLKSSFKKISLLSGKNLNIYKSFILLGTAFLTFNYLKNHKYI